MATVSKITDRVRLELGDLPEPFRGSFRGDGEQVDFDLPARNILADSVRAFQIKTDATTTDFTIDDYTLDVENGSITFATPPAVDELVIVEGNSFGIFSDTEIVQFVNDAAAQHLKDRTTEKRFRDGHGFIRYDRKPMELEDLPEEENVLISILATIESLWALSTDASLDIDVQTAEGTSLPRGQRWRQLTAQIDLLTDKYKELSLMMGVGLFAPEVLTMRRVSRSTGRLIPVFQEREYDETGPPIRKTPPIPTRDSDPDGPESPWWSGGWGY